MKERLFEFLRSENKSSAQLADEIGVQPSGISHILSGRNNPSLDFVLKMLDKYPNLSTEWLLFGKGTMYRENKITSLFDEFSVTQPVTGERPAGSERVIRIGDDRSGGLAANEKDQDDERVDTRATVTRIVMFFSDNSFEEYFPKK